MDKLADKVKIWHLILLVALQLAGFIYVMGAKNERMNEIGKIARQNHETTIQNRERLQRMEVLNERIKSLNDKMARIEKKIDELNSTILDIYKDKWSMK